MSRFSDWRKERSVNKAIKTITKVYNAGNGKNSPRSNYGSGGGSADKFQGGTDDYLGVVEFNHTELRGKSRKAAFDSPAIAAIQERKTQTTVDTGIMIDPTPDIEKIGLTEAQAADFIEYAKSFNEWMGCKQQHRREQMTFFQGQGLAQTEKIRDGEYFFRLYYNREDNLPHPLQWEALDADQFPDWTSTITQDGADYVETDTEEKQPADAIIKDSRGRAVKYVVMTNENGVITQTTLSAKTADGRYQVLHGFTPQYSFQTRGFPHNAAVLQDSKLLQEFTLANIKKAINQSHNVYSVENDKQDPTSPFDEKNLEEVLGNMFNIDPETDTGTPNEDTLNYLSSPLFKNLVLNSQPGSNSMIMPEAGTRVKALENTAPVQDYDTFVGAFFSFLAAAENVPVEVALMKFGQNYSASRAALIMFWRICEVERMDLDSDLLSPFYEMYIAEGIAMGFVSAPGWTDSRIRQWYIRHRIIGAPMPSIDPYKESKASVEQLAVGSTSFSRNAQNLNGSDFDKNLNENLEYIDKMNTLRLGLGQNKAVPGSPNGN